MNERIKELRKYLNITQQEFADRLNVSRNTVATYEIGKSNPSDAAIMLICREFNVNEEWLRDGVGEMFVKRDKIQVISEFAADMIKEPESFKARLFESLAKLDEKDWIAIEQIFDKLTGSKDS